MSSSVFGRTKTEVGVKQADLFVLYCMLRRIHFNTAAFLATHFQTFACSKDIIVVGDIISTIACVGSPR